MTLSKAIPDSFIIYMANRVFHLVQCPREDELGESLLPLPVFIKSVYRKCSLSPAVLFASLIYLERLKKRLPVGSNGEYDTPYKLFLSSVILATKYIEDHRKHTMVIYKFVSSLYNLKELSEMERSFLGFLNFDLYVDRDEMFEFTKKHQDKLETNRYV
ncbi:hypothetical protein BY458DRAFT_513576 [Sporodiniella umbellata]|nr:hypothetical protein BY458DRAFT_513576 [Sporodiniella umbellata]